MSKVRCWSIELLSHDVVEHILEKLPVKSLVRFKIVSKQWKSTIESRYFQEKQLKYCRNSRDPNILLMTSGEDNNGINFEALSTLVFKSSASVKIPTPVEKIIYDVCPSSCDGLICFHCYDSGIVVNPTTRWHRIIPPPRYQQQQLIRTRLKNGSRFFPLPLLGFGKDKFNNTYKPVWLYNSSELGLKNATTCEVFDFSTNSWRYITPSSPYRIIAYHDPAYVDGSLHWFTKCEETKVLSFDLHTEKFQVIAKAPFANVNPNDIIICNLDNRLCVSEKKWPNQLIWSFDSGNKTWDKMYTIDLDAISHWFGKKIYPFSPLAVLEKKKKINKLLFSTIGPNKTLVVHDPNTKSYDSVFTAKSVGYHLVSYLETLVSIL